MVVNQSRAPVLLVLSLLLLQLMIFLFTSNSAAALSLTNRLVKVSSSSPSAISAHTFNFAIPSINTLGSIEFEYCANDPFIGATCDAPNGLNTEQAVLADQSGEIGFSVDPSLTTTNKVVLTRIPTTSAQQAVEYVIENVTNPSTPKQTTFVRVSTFATNNASGSRLDSGAVAFSTSGALSVGGFVPPYLTMCAGVSVSLDCSSSAGVLVDLGELTRFSTATQTSQFAVSTNDPAGYSTFILGTTLTAGNNIIPPMKSTDVSLPGFGQYGMNLVDNLSPDVGVSVVGGGSGGPSSNYGTANQFRFVSGDQIAASSVSSDFNRYTVSYIANISDQEQPGFYSATMTFLSTAAF